LVTILHLRRFRSSESGSMAAPFTTLAAAVGCNLDRYMRQNRSKP
jgi:hypothetical protein